MSASAIAGFCPSSTSSSSTERERELCQLRVELLLGPVIRGSVSGYMTYCAARSQAVGVARGLRGSGDPFRRGMEWASSARCSDTCERKPRVGAILSQSASSSQVS